MFTINDKPNCLGTLDISAKLGSMRKPQDFVVYPIKKQIGPTDRILIQSDTRIGYVYLDSGEVHLSKPHSSGAYFPHLSEAQLVHTLTGEELLMLKTKLAGTSNPVAGTNGVVVTDNSGAINALAL